MDINRIEKFFDIMDTTDISELCWEKDDIKIRVKRKKKETAPTIEPEQISETAETQTEKSENYCTIKSKMVGTFYLNNKKQNKPYIKEGNSVKKGQTLGVIEAMKIMKEVVSDIDGTLDKVLVSNAKPVEYGEELFLIKK